MKNYLCLLFLVVNLSICEIAQANKVVVVPLGPEGKQVDALLVPIAVAYVNNTTVTAKLTTSAGFESGSRISTGVYQLTLSKTMVGAPVILATAYDVTPDDENITANAVNNTTIEINIIDANGDPTDSHFYVAVYANTE